MKRIREIVWPWAASSTLNHGFEERLTIRNPRQDAEIISICVVAGELKVFLEEHIGDRVGKDRVLTGFAASKAGRFEIPDDASFVLTVPMPGNAGAMHVFELNRPPSAKIDPFYRAPSLSPFDPEPAPHSLLHKAWVIRETLRIQHMNAHIDRAGYESYRVSDTVEWVRVEKRADGVSRETGEHRE